jgi:arylsulfatase A-like enzyme
MAQELSSSSGAARKILKAALWFGLLTGLVEGVGFIALQRLNWLTAKTGLVDVSIDIVWFSVVFNLLLFAIIGLMLALAARFVPKLLVIKLAIFVFALLTFFDWLTLALFGRVRLYAIAALALGLAVQCTRLIIKNEVRLLRLWRPGVVSAALLALVLGLGVSFYGSIRERQAIAQLPAHKEGSPNIVLIVVDALRADHLSSYGYRRATSPNMDQLASRGVLFENAFSASSWTLPSHVSLFTGRYPTEHEADWSNPTALRDAKYSTLAEALKARGYRTAGFSGNLYWVTRQFGLDRGFIHFEDYLHSLGDMAVRTIYGRAIETAILQRLGFEDIPARRRAADINDSALKWISGDTQKPFFLFINYMDVHDPYLPPLPHRQRFSNRNDPGGILNWRLGRNDPKMTTEQLADEISSYDGAISYVDEQIGNLVSGLRNRGLSDNTIFVVTSDHGEMFGEHNLYLHGHSLYRGEIHVPLIVSYANTVPAGLRIGQPVSNTFVATTVMSLIGVDDETLFPGRSLSHLWNNSHQTAGWPSPVSHIAQQFWVNPKLPVHHGSINSVIDPQWHYIENEKLGVELYRVQEDPLELNDLAKSPDAQDLIRAFRSEFVNGGSTTMIGRRAESGKQNGN